MWQINESWYIACEKLIGKNSTGRIYFHTYHYDRDDVAKEMSNDKDGQNEGIGD